jgi:hypothetical protein
MKESSTESFEAVARAICGKVSPTREMVASLRAAAAGIAASARQEEEAPSADDLRDRLAVIRAAALKLAAEIKDHNILGRLDGARIDPTTGLADRMHYIFVLEEVLPDLASRALDAKSAVFSSSGKKTVANADALTAQQTCALVVYRAWTVARGAVPGVGLHAAHQACDVFWQSCGQQSIGESLTGWRRHIEVARDVLTRPQQDTHASIKSTIESVKSLAILTP